MRDVAAYIDTHGVRFLSIFSDDIAVCASVCVCVCFCFFFRPRRCGITSRCSLTVCSAVPDTSGNERHASECVPNPEFVAVSRQCGGKDLRRASGNPKVPLPHGHLLPPLRSQHVQQSWTAPSQEDARALCQQPLREGGSCSNVSPIWWFPCKCRMRTHLAPL